MPNVLMLLPADGNETVGAYKIVVENRKSPPSLHFRGKSFHTWPAHLFAGVAKGGYIISDNSTGNKPDLILFGSASELEIAAKSVEVIRKEGKTMRVASLVSYSLPLLCSSTHSPRCSTVSSIFCLYSSLAFSRKLQNSSMKPFSVILGEFIIEERVRPEGIQDPASPHAHPHPSAHVLASFVVVHFALLMGAPYNLPNSLLSLMVASLLPTIHDLYQL